MIALSTAELERILGEDVPYGDLTTEVLGIGARPGCIRFSARHSMVVAGIEEAAALFKLVGVETDLHVRSGDAVASDAILLQGNGCARALHTAWKVAQTLVEICSGVATATRALVSAARTVGPEVAIVCTRKNVPGAKGLAVAAIKAGGATMHRLGLSETILVFPEHRVFYGEADLAAMARDLRVRAPEKKLVIEVNSIVEGLAAASAGFDVIQAEKFTPDLISRLVSELSAKVPRLLVAAAGGINPDNAGAYVRAGADILVTSWPHTARPLDVAVQITALT